MDLLHNEFLKLGVKSKRIGSNSDQPTPEEKQRYFSDKDSNKKEEQIQSFKFFSIFKRNIQEAQVICATCVGSKSDCLKNLRFPRVIIDEATQATETACLIPLIRDCQQLVLFSSYHFYNNLLENGVGEEQRKPIGGFTWPNQVMRIAFIHAKGLEQVYATSVQNIMFGILGGYILTVFF